jgi:hypothetical protein
MEFFGSLGWNDDDSVSVFRVGRFGFVRLVLFTWVLLDWVECVFVDLLDCAE